MRSRAALLVVGAVVLSVTLVSAQQLFPADGIRISAVRQGGLGSCYFHSVIAAIAHTRPDVLRGMIEAKPDGSFQVKFLDGKIETVHSEDVKYAEENQFDRSEGRWVIVLFRAYAQRVLRQGLIEAAQKVAYFDFLKQAVADYVNAHDELLLMYDHAIRAQVKQDGTFSSELFRENVRSQIQALALPTNMRDFLLRASDQPAFYDSIAQMVKENGEIFGAYRAVGQGGYVRRTMQVFAGSVEDKYNKTPEVTRAWVSEVMGAHRPAVACTAGSRYAEALAKKQPLPEGSDWYVDAHCYTVTAFDEASGKITTRNPWAHPGPDGVVELPLDRFHDAFWGLQAAK